MDADSLLASSTKQSLHAIGVWECQHQLASGVRKTRICSQRQEALVRRAADRHSQLAIHFEISTTVLSVRGWEGEVEDQAKATFSVVALVRLPGFGWNQFLNPIPSNPPFLPVHHPTPSFQWSRFSFKAFNCKRPCAWCNPASLILANHTKGSTPQSLWLVGKKRILLLNQIECNPLFVFGLWWHLDNNVCCTSTTWNLFGCS